MNKNCFVVVPWVHQQERVLFLAEWGIKNIPSWLILQHDQHRDGCGVTKNKGIKNAVRLGAEIVVVLDSDCFPSDEAVTLPELAYRHCEALQPQRIELYETVTIPPVARHSVL